MSSTEETLPKSGNPRKKWTAQHGIANSINHYVDSFLWVLLVNNYLNTIGEESEKYNLGLKTMFFTCLQLISPDMPLPHQG